MAGSTGQVLAGNFILAEDFQAELDALLARAPKSATKTADTSRDTTTTLTADPHLVVPVAADTAYTVEMTFSADSGSGTPDLKIGWSAPAGATMVNWSVHWSDAGGLHQFLNLATLATTLAIATDTTIRPLQVLGTLTVGSTAGDLSFLWSQNTSSGTVTTIRTGASLKLTPIATT